MDEKHTKTHLQDRIAFDEKHNDVLNIATKVMDKLRIEYSLQPKIQAHCQVINMRLPVDLLKKYGMFWNGNKYDAQPIPDKNIVKNIEFAAGLINSDGYRGLVLSKYKRIGFSNTVKTIAESLALCLRFNKIKFGSYSYELKPDKRTQRVYKKPFQIIIGKREEIEKFEKKSRYLK